MRLLAAALACVVSVGLSATAQEQERKTPKDSVKLVVTGCLDDRILRATDVSTPELENAPGIARTIFRLSGKKDVLEQLKQRESRELSVTGYVRKMDLQEPGMKVKGGRVVFGAPTTDPRRPSLPDTGERPIVLDVLSFEESLGSCPERR